MAIQPPPHSATGSLESLRDRNRGRVVEVLRRRGRVSRAEIARQTGLSRSTVSTIVNGLISSGTLVEIAVDASPRGPEGGRPPMLVALAPTTGVLVGLDFYHDHVRVAIADVDYSIKGELASQTDTDREADASLAVACEMVDRLLTEHGVDRDQVISAGVGLPGPLDRTSGIVPSELILPSWSQWDVAAEIERRLGFPVHVDNDANVGALGEWLFGAGRGCEALVFVRLSAGIGLGMVLGGQPFRGAAGVAGELGHMLVDPAGPICRCGNRGCLETIVSSTSLCEMLRRSHGEVSVPQMLQLVADGDRGAVRALQDAARVIGRELARVCNLINPDALVVGGELALAGETLLEPLRAAIRQHAIPAAARVDVVTSALGDRAELLGALALAGHESGELLSAVPGQRRRSQ